MNKDQIRIEVLATIDELNQYLLGNVTIDAAVEACKELRKTLLYTYKTNTTIK